jgi:formamidopyrimidine-DNA glycosylase
VPELPEVETHVRDLQKLVGRSFRAVWSNTPKAFKPSFAVAQKKLVSQKILAIRRRAKHIIFDLSGSVTLVAHFRMTGHFLIRKLKDPLEKCVRHRFELSGGTDLRFDDIRKFGTLTVCDARSHESVCRLDQLGPEPLEPDFSFAAFQNCLAKKKGLLKAMLLDQSVIAGIGNIYADEICFTAGLHPASRVENLNIAQLKTVHRAIIRELSKGVKNRGTTVGEFMDSDGQAGGNQHTLRAYKRHGLPCKKCGQIMQKMKIVQRTTSFCVKCQQLV